MLAATLTINMVGGVLLRKAANQNVQQVTDLSASLSNEITDASFEKIHGGLIDAARQMGGRLFLVDRDAKVIFDTFDERCGTLLPYGAVQTVLSGEVPMASAVRRKFSPARRFPPPWPDRFSQSRARARRREASPPVFRGVSSRKTGNLKCLTNRNPERYEPHPVK